MNKMMLVSEWLRLKKAAQYAFAINCMLLILLTYILYIAQQSLISGVGLFIVTSCYSVIAVVIGSYQSALLLKPDNKAFLLLRPQTLFQLYLAAIIAGIAILVMSLLLPLVVITTFSLVADDVDLGELASVLVKVTLVFLCCYLTGFIAKLQAKRIALILLFIPLILLILSVHLQLSVLALFVLLLILVTAGAASFKANNSKYISHFNQRRALLLPISLVIFVILSLVLKLLFQWAIVGFDSKYQGNWHAYFAEHSYEKIARQRPEQLQQFLAQQFKNIPLANAKYFVQLKNSFVTFMPLSGTLTVKMQQQMPQNQINLDFSEGKLLLRKTQNGALLPQHIAALTLGYTRAEIKDITLFYDENYSWLAILLQQQTLWHDQPFLEFIQIENQSAIVNSVKLTLPHAWSKGYLARDFILSPALTAMNGLNSVSYLTSMLSTINSTILLVALITNLLCFFITLYANTRRTITLTEQRFWLFANAIVGIPALLTYLLLFSLQKQVAVKSDSLNE